MKRYFFLLPLFVTSIVVQAQEVEFEIPAGIRIVQGRLSVTFRDSVPEETARSLVTGPGYEIIDIVFEPRTVWAVPDGRLTDEQVRALEADPRVISLSQSLLPGPERSRPRHSLVVAFQSHVSADEAAALLKRAAGAVVTRTEKRPGEIVIDVGDRDAEAVALLEGRAEVRRVTYVGVPGG